jgi:hypothetical protein
MGAVDSDVSLTKQQQEIVEFIQCEFAKYGAMDRHKMYEAIRLAASIKWPQEWWGPTING